MKIIIKPGMWAIAYDGRTHLGEMFQIDEEWIKNSGNISSHEEEYYFSVTVDIHNFLVFRTRWDLRSKVYYLLWQQKQHHMSEVYKHNQKINEIDSSMSLLGL